MLLFSDRMPNLSQPCILHVCYCQSYILHVMNYLGLVRISEQPMILTAGLLHSVYPH